MELAGPIDDAGGRCSESVGQIFLGDAIVAQPKIKINKNGKRTETVLSKLRGPFLSISRRLGFSP